MNKIRKLNLKGFAMLRIAIVIMAIGLSLGNAAAEVSYTAPRRAGFPIVSITGEIRSQDVATFKSLVEVAKSNSPLETQLGEKIFRVELNSNGGSVSAAMQMGNIIRNSGAVVIVQKESICVSSCVFLLAAGNERSVYGRVGIHRPILSNDDADTPKGQVSNYKYLESKIKAYLSTMNVPTTLYDAMFRVPPERVRYLTSDELEKYNLNENDPYYQEAVDTIVAKKWGLNKAQYVQFKAATPKYCATVPSDLVHACFEKLAKSIKNASN